MNIEYRLAGKSGNLFTVGLLAGPLFVVPFCIAYAYANVSIPYVFLTPFVYVVLLYAIHSVQKRVVLFSNCRSVSASRLYGKLWGLFVVYAVWCAFLFLMFRQGDLQTELVDWMIHPTLVFQKAYALSVDRSFTFLEVVVEGPILWFVWILEALGIVGVAILGGYVVMLERVFCEDCNRWAEDVPVKIRLAILNKETAKSTIETDVTGLLDYKMHDGGFSEHIRVNLHHCSKCRNTSAIDVDYINYETNDKGGIKVKIEDLGKTYVLSAFDYNRFVDWKNQISP